MDREGLLLELNFKAVRSSGKGGQHVNKVSTKVELQFDLENSESLTDDEKIKLIERLKTKLSKENKLILHCSETRSQFKNKQLVIERLFQILEEGLKEQKKRIATKTPKSVKAKRLRYKKLHSDKKSSRRKPNLD